MNQMKNVLNSRWATAILIIVFSLTIHFPFVVFDSFGEQDAARIGNQVVLSSYSGELEVPNLLPFTVPLYLHSLFHLVNSEWLLPSQLPTFMAALSLAMSAFLSAGFYLFVLEQSKSRLAATIGTLGIQFAPIYWISSLYGFPTIVALGILMCSLVLFQHTFNSSSKRIKIVGSVACFLVFLAAVCCKVDMIFGAALFFVPIWNSQDALALKLKLSAIVAVSAIFAFWLFNLYAKSLTAWPDSPPSRQWINWFNHFFRGLSLLFTSKNLATIGAAMGVFTFWLATIGIAICFVSRKQVWLVLGALLVSIAVIFFWSLIGGNSARHNFIPAILLWIPIIVPLTIGKLAWRATWSGAILCLTIANYFYYPPSSSTVRPSGRLIESVPEFSQRVRQITEDGDSAAAIPEDKVLVVSQNSLIPYFHFSVLSDNGLAYVDEIEGGFLMKQKEELRRFIFIDRSELQKIEELMHEGYHAVNY